MILNTHKHKSITSSALLLLHESLALSHFLAAWMNFRHAVKKRFLISKMFNLPVISCRFSCSSSDFKMCSKDTYLGLENKITMLFLHINPPFYVAALQAGDGCRILFWLSWKKQPVIMVRMILLLRFIGAEKHLEACEHVFALSFVCLFGFAFLGSSL